MCGPKDDAAQANCLNAMSGTLKSLPENAPQRQPTEGLSLTVPDHSQAQGHVCQPARDLDQSYW